MENGPFIWFTWVYLLKMVIVHGYVSHNQMVSINGIQCYYGFSEHVVPPNTARSTMMFPIE